MARASDLWSVITLLASWIVAAIAIYYMRLKQQQRLSPSLSSSSRLLTYDLPVEFTKVFGVMWSILIICSFWCCIWQLVHVRLSDDNRVPVASNYFYACTWLLCASWVPLKINSSNGKDNKRTIFPDVVVIAAFPLALTAALLACDRYNATLLEIVRFGLPVSLLAGWLCVVVVWLQIRKRLSTARIGAKEEETGVQRADIVFTADVSSAANVSVLQPLSSVFLLVVFVITWCVAVCDFVFPFPAVLALVYVPVFNNKFVLLKWSIIWVLNGMIVLSFVLCII